MSIEDIKKALKDSAKLKLRVADTLSAQILEATEIISTAISGGKKVMFCGNGGSAADSQHLAAELVVRLTGKVNRKALPGMALTTDTSILTAASNDYGFDNIFSRQIEAHGVKGDVLVTISTSGNSPNILNAVNTAKQNGIVTIALLGKGGGKLGPTVDFAIVVPSDDTQRIQESHITIGHIIIQLVENRLFK